MNRLDELIAKLCPNGVEYKSLGEIATISRGGNFQKKDFCDSGVPCIHYGQLYTKYGLFADETITFITEERAKKQKFAKTNDIIMAVTSENIEDVCKCIAWLGNDDVAVSGHSAIISHNQNPKYLVYYFHSQMFFVQKRKLAHGTKVIEVTPDTLKSIKLPVPPLEVQREIVQILDNFTSLTAELQTKLQAELQARKKQYEYYRDKLLNFETNIHKEKLKSVAKISRGVRVTKSQLTDNGYPVYQNALTPMGYHSEYNVSGGTTYVISAGAAGEIGFSDENFWAADDCLVFTELNGVTNKYIYHFLMTKKNYIKTRVRKASIPRLPREVIENLLIPTPSIEIQNKIVDILDNFEKICSDLNIGLPAEIEARQKQYEFYHDALLSFDNSYFVNVERERERER